MSPAEVAELPPTVVTVTSTMPLPAGEVTVTDVAVLAVRLVAGVVPNLTAVAEPRLVPLMTTVVPPAEVPLVGTIEVTVGAAT